MFGASSISSIGYGLLFYFDRSRAEQLTTEITWNTVRLYHKINLEYSKLKRLYCSNTVNKVSKSDDENDDDDTNLDEEEDNYNLEFLGYNIKNNHITTYSTFKIENNKYINDNEFDLMFLKQCENDEVLYKRINDKTEINKNIEIHKINKPFIQVELNLNNEDSISIHRKLIPFYTNNNDILDKTFLYWYVKTFYDITIDDNYKLNIIDSDINMFNIEKHNFLRLKEIDDNNKYQVISL